MMQVNVYYLEEGDILAEPVTTRSGATMLGTGTRLTGAYIQRLKSLGIRYVAIRNRELNAETETDSSSALPSKEEVMLHPNRPHTEFREISDHTRKQLTKKVRMTLYQLMDSERIQVRSSIPLLEERFQRIFRSILYDISSHEDVIEHLVKLYVTDVHLFNHSLNVAILSGIIGLAYQYDNGMMLELTIGALLFDVGMIKIPTQIIKSKKS